MMVALEALKETVIYLTQDVHEVLVRIEQEENILGSNIEKTFANFEV